jgi:hypothetical protein
MTDLIVERNTAFLVFEHAHGSAGN